jgi:hypothetical protein
MRNTPAKLARRARTVLEVQTPMASDPYIFDNVAEVGLDRAMLERRACQYGVWIAERDGLLRDAPRAYNASFDGVATVTLAMHGTDVHEIVVRIPENIMAFDPEAPAIALIEPSRRNG